MMMYQDEANKYIVIGGDNLNTLGIIRSLGEVGIIPIIILYKEDSIKLVAHSKYTKQLFYVTNIDDGIALMKDFASEKCRSFVYTTDDNTQSYLDLHYDELIGNFIFYNAGEAGRITKFMNKKTICDLAEECGFNVPKSEVVSRGELPKAIHYPIITKTLNPYAVGWKKDVGIFYSDEELLNAYEGMISEKLLLQEYIKKHNEVAIQCISINGGETLLFSYYSMLYRFTDTSFGGYKHYHILKDQILKDKIKTIITKIHYSGIFEIEFLVNDNDTLSFLEINFRSSAANYNLTYGNVNLPYLWSKMVTENKNIDVKLLERPFSCMNGTTDFSQFVATHKMSFIKWYRDYRNADCHRLYNPNDRAPFYYFLISKLGRKIKKLL